MNTYMNIVAVGMRDQYRILNGKKIIAKFWDEKVWHDALMAHLAGKKAALPAPEVVANEFVRVLYAWSRKRWVTERHGKGAWDEMIKTNAAKESGDSSCASHDWCDANMAMDEALRNLGLGARLDAEGVCEDGELNDLWNAAWTAAMPMLSGKAPLPEAV